MKEIVERIKWLKSLGKDDEARELAYENGLDPWMDLDLQLAVFGVDFSD